MRHLISIIILVSSGVAFANEALYTDYDEVVFIGRNFGNEEYSLTFRVKKKDKGLSVKSAVFSIGDLTYAGDKSVISKLKDPHLSEVEIFNDSGINGDFYSISIPFGKNVKCKKYWTKSKKMEQVVIRFVRHAPEESKTYVSSPCKKE